VGTKIFNQAHFVSLIDDEIKERGIAQVEITRLVGLKGPAYNAWRAEKSALSIEQVVAICKFFGWRPAWAMFDEGPKSDAEAENVELIRGVIQSLSTAAQLAVSHVEYLPQPQIKEEISNARKALSAELARSPVELPPPLYAALKSLATALRPIDAPQVSICQVAHRQGGEQEPSAPQGVQ